MTSSIRLVITPGAERDVENIAQYTLERWGSRQVATYRSLLYAAFHRIQAFPDLGRAVSPDDPNLRELVLDYHTIVYRRDPDAVTILRIVNPRRLRR
jgi:toxin ParE1/3/4